MKVGANATSMRSSAFLNNDILPIIVSKSADESDGGLAQPPTVTTMSVKKRHAVSLILSSRFFDVGRRWAVKLAKLSVSR